MLQETTPGGHIVVSGVEVIQLAQSYTDIGWPAGVVSALGYDRYSYRADVQIGDKAGAHLVKFAGQLCYKSFGEKRSRELSPYLQKLVSQKHGSVFEHLSFSFVFLGIDRNVTHELVRHRAGFSYSQTSTRYCIDDRYVFPYTLNWEDHNDRTDFFNWLDQTLERSMHFYAADPKDKVDREKRKPFGLECKEAPIMVTANLRAWHNMLLKRTAEGVYPPMRTAALEVQKTIGAYMPELIYCGHEV